MMKDLSAAHRRSILKKPLVIIFIVYFIISLVLVITGLSYYNIQKEKILNNRYEYLASISGYNNTQVAEWLNSKFAQLEVLRTNSILIKRIESIASSKNNKEELTEWFNTLKTLFQYEHITLVNNSNNIIYSLPNENIKLSSADSLLCRSAKEEDSVLFSDSDDAVIKQEPLKFYVPLGNSKIMSQQIENVLILAINPHNTFNKILNLNIDKSPTQEALLVKSFNENIVYLNTLRNPADINEPGKDNNRKALTEADRIIPGKDFMEGIDYKNDQVVAVMKSIPGTNWTLITKIDKSEFYAPINDLAKVVILTVVSTNLIFLLVLVFIWRKSILSNYKQMYKAEIDKAKSENRFDSLVNGVKDIAIIILDEKGNIISWNEGAEIIEGYSAHEITGKHISILYSEDERMHNKPQDNLRYALDYGSFQEENWRIRKNGTAFWANVLITALRDKNENVYGYLKVTRDLTDKKKSEEEIEKSRDFYLKLLNDFPTLVWRSGLDGKYDYFNKAWLNYTGRTIEEEAGSGWTSNLHPEEKDRIVKLSSEAFSQKKNFMMEYRLRNSKGEYKWMVDFGMPYFDIDNNFCGYIGSLYDVDDRKKYEETINALLRIGEKLYSSLEIDQILDSLITESIQMTNAAGGYACISNEDEYEIKRYYNMDHWEYYEKRYNLENNELKRFISQKETVLFNEKNLPGILDLELGKRYNIQNGIAVPLWGSNGNLIGYFEIHNKKEKNEFSREDINLLNAVAKNASVSIAKSLNFEQLRKTEKQLRNSESELRNLAMQLQFAREAERQHIAREVHDELGQLFTGINLNISLLTELLEQNKKPKVDDILVELHSVQQYVNMGIQAVRDISGSLRSYVLDHLGLIPAVQEYCREIERMSNVRCNFKSEFESLKFNDERNVALFRIIQEAITNVLRHAEATAIDVVISRSGSFLEIIIADNGIGMAEENDSSRNSVGILGMKERVIFLDGKLKIESTKNKGTTIRLLIPFDEKENKTGNR